MTGKAKLTRERVISLLDYDPTNGSFTWKWRSDIPRRANVRNAGKPAGTNKDGYRVIMIDDKQYRAHRLAHLIVTGRWPTGDLDHKDMDRSNNAWSNIRPATRSQNHCNKRMRSDSNSGFKGVGWHNQAKRWRARIQIHGKQILLGLFDTPEEAAKAYADAVSTYHGAFARCD